ncbi:MAG: TetR/AcrR family transcriptional regulator [Candidatus Hermodarchaeota archaeon]
MVENKRRTRNKPRKIKKLKEATMKLIAERGYSEITTHDIAKEADVSVGLVYKYFPGGKPDLVRALAKKFSEEILGEEELTNLTQEMFSEAISNIVERLVIVHRKNDKLIAAIQQTATLNIELSKDLIQEKYELNPFKRILEKMYFNSFNDKKELLEWSKILASMIDSRIHQHVIYYGSEEDQRIIKTLTNFILWIFREKQ